jgi:hypothetical protein
VFSVLVFVLRIERSFELAILGVEQSVGEGARICEYLLLEVRRQVVQDSGGCGHVPDAHVERLSLSGERNALGREAEPLLWHHRSELSRAENVSLAIVLVVRHLS